MCSLFLLLIFVLIFWKMIYDISIMIFGIILGLISIAFGIFCRDDSMGLCMLFVLLGIALIVLGIMFKEISIGVFVDGIPGFLMFWK